MEELIAPRTPHHRHALVRFVAQTHRQHRALNTVKRRTPPPGRAVVFGWRGRNCSSGQDDHVVRCHDGVVGQGSY